jgi:hypothetical protein
MESPAPSPPLESKKSPVTCRSVSPLSIRPISRRLASCGTPRNPLKRSRSSVSSLSSLPSCSDLKSLSSSYNSTFLDRCKKRPTLDHSSGSLRKSGSFSSLRKSVGSLRNTTSSETCKECGKAISTMHMYRDNAYCSITCRDQEITLDDMSSLAM